MVQLALRASNDVKDWHIVELQGELECHDADLRGKLIGDLQYTLQGVPVFVIGHHILYGKVSKLEKPFAVMRKFESIETEETQNGYEIIAVIKKKVVFKARPKPIISNVSTKL